MSEIWVQMLVGQNPEPFLEAALRSVAWADGFAVVNTDPEGSNGASNEAVVRRVVPREKLRVERLRMSRQRFDFARARNLSLSLIPDDAYVLIVDADDVHWPEFEDIARNHITRGHDIVTVHFYHLAVYKDLLHSERHREILLLKTPEVRFERGVHELLRHPRKSPVLSPTYRYAHYGYIRSARDVARRWEFYRSLGAEIHDYDTTQPDKALDDWPRICTPFWRDHPPAIREVLESWPSAPVQPRPEHPPRVGLVMLTWNDAENLEECLRSLATTEEPFELAVVDNGSTDDTLDPLLWNLQSRRGEAPFSDVTVYFRKDQSLVQGLNEGFGHFLGRESIDYVGWVHPDHVFDWPDWLGNMVRLMDENPDWVKLGAQEVDDGNRELREGNSQCYLIRRSALEKVGLFDDRFLACGGYEDWEHNHRLMPLGRVMISPEALVRHKAMGTRSNHDNVDAARQNADLYHSIVGQWEAVV